LLLVDAVLAGAKVKNRKRENVTTAISLKTRAEFEKKTHDTKTVFGRLVSSELGFSCRLVCKEDGAEHVERIRRD
jgi:hypothetical protein